MNTSTQNPLSHGERIGKYVLYQRKKRGWSLADYAKKAGIAASFLHRLEQGQYNTVKLDVIEGLAEALQMSVFSFLYKCQIIEQGPMELPSFAYYLKEKFQFPQEAIDDMELFFEFVNEKYLSEIERMREMHQRYWSE